MNHYELNSHILTDENHSVYLILNKIPHTASNKIDRKALAEVYSNVDIAAWEQALGEAGGSEHQGEDDEKWGEVEETIRDVVMELTGVPSEGVRKRTHLKALGVDSVGDLLCL
jgi:hypothetical protein